MHDRVQKILSQWGIASRRQAEQMILEGRVRLNGAIAHLGQKADPSCDRVEVDGVAIQPVHRPEPVYLLLNKPVGYVSTCHDPQNRRTVLDLLPSQLSQSGVHPVGRLDIDSTGALLLTNDGDLTFYLTHPRHHIPKTYRVWVEGYPSESLLQRWRQGVVLSGQKTLPAQVTLLKRHPQGKTLLEVVLREGRNRQIRRISEQLGHPVIQLHRIAIGPIQLNPAGEPALPSGACRSLKDIEISFLKSQIDLPSVREPVEREEYSL